MDDRPAGSGTLIGVLDPVMDEVDRDAARRVARGLRANDGAELMLRTAGGQVEHLPRGVANLMASMLEEVAEGHTVALVSDAEEISTSAAAAFLGVSRPHVVKLIDTGLLPARMAGTHRRVRMTDLVAYKHTVERRHAFLDELAVESEEMGLYDAPPTQKP
ncbi:MAG TPA: helix-turn-helix domain-containing protein [Longimicrobium sp.]|jgi:excisionase family DNA binding protein|nr:helix-turn-helix domain-containing protein [Longimicrobium sp.]